VKGFYEPRSGSIQYVVTDPKTRRCAIIDPVYEFDEKSGATATHQADEILAYVAREGLTVEWILDTHPHADHFSAAHYLKQKTGAPTAIGARHGCPEALAGPLQLAGTGDRRLAMGPALRRGRQLQGGRAHGARDVLARPPLPP
jgi:glyoxylase-like metal-dependent hydrolase (beta-lactamase superfamily II)